MKKCDAIVSKACSNLQCIISIFVYWNWLVVLAKEIMNMFFLIQTKHIYMEQS